MKSLSFLKNALLVVFLVFFTTVIFAQGQEKSSGYIPHVGQAGKDVIWVPTPDALVAKMLELAKVTSSDVLVDLGSGDGRTVIAAAKLNADATGIEFNGDMVELSKKKAEEEGVSDKAKFIQTDLFDYDLSNATVITMFLLPQINLKLRPRLLDLKPGTRIVSNTFTMGEWKPDQEATIEGSSSWSTALLWIVPAKIEGKWNLSAGELSINQQFQKFFGSLKKDNIITPVSEGKIDGSNISFRIGNSVYSGKLTDDNAITGTVTTNSKKSDFVATKEKKNSPENSK
jgi:SAM-dependent methyltransferase